MLESYWHNANNDTIDLKNEDSIYKNDAFQHVPSTFFNLLAARVHYIIAGNLMLHFMHSIKKKLAAIS